MNNKQQLKEQSLLYLLSQNNFIVPEIQREYVWGQNEDVISRFIESIIEKIGTVCDQCGNPKKSTKINIGFLYTYKPSYVTYNHERFLDENLIDGQQRFTTLVLLLFYNALKEDRVLDFKEAIRFEEGSEMAFDYKVRNLTHVFLLELFKRVNTLEELIAILEKKATWFLNDFKDDLTVSSILKALSIINGKFSARSERYYDYILNNIKFYHFRTEATNQGEELYITMNARGEALSKNEENKASLMFDDSSLFEFGSKWEEWQDFFWKNRDKSNPSSNADIGFNEFLRWIQIIEMTLSDVNIDTNEDEKITDGSMTKKIVTLIQGENISLDKNHFSIEKIEKYIGALKYLYEDYYNDVEYKNKYSSSLDLTVLKQRYLHPKDKKIDQGECFELLPALYYVFKSQSLKQVVNNQNVFRLLRFLNNLRKDENVRKSINKQVINAIKLVDSLLDFDGDIATIYQLQPGQVSKTLLTPEEGFKFSTFINQDNREELENDFWIAEDNSILKGKLAPLLQYSFFNEEERPDFVFEKTFEKFESVKFNLKIFRLLFLNFLKLTQENTKDLSDNIWANMLLTDYYKLKDYNELHKLIVCDSSDDFHLLRSKYFLNKLDEISKFESSVEYFKDIFNSFLSKYNSLDELSQEENFKNQVYLYYIALVNKRQWWYWKGKNFGVYLKPKNYTSFFNINIRFQHYKLKWAGADYNYFDDKKSSIINFYKPFFDN